jgi:hypothetical protein
MAKASSLPAFLLALLAVAGCSPRPGTVEGKAAIDSAPAAGAEVQAFVRSGEERSGTPFATGTAREDGTFALSLPAGRYYLVVRKTVRQGGRDRAYKGEFPGNPVTGAAGRTASGIVVPLAEMSSGGFTPREGTGVTGVVSSAGKPAAGAFVYAYPEDAGTARGPAYSAFARTGEDGRFSLALREGAFLVVARDKGGENETGAMTGGGRTGEGLPVRLAPGETKDLGRIALRAPDERKRRLRSERGGQEGAAAEIRGTVVRDDGSPAPGVVVMAYGDHRMIGRPFAISGRTGKDGAFALRLPKGGKYHLGARTESGGPVSPGEWVGTYDGTPDHSVTARQGEVLEGIRLRVSEKW